MYSTQSNTTPNSIFIVNIISPESQTTFNEFFRSYQPAYDTAIAMGGYEYAQSGDSFDIISAAEGDTDADVNVRIEAALEKAARVYHIVELQDNILANQTDRVG